MKKRKYLFSIIRGGKIRVTSKKQHKLLHSIGAAHTHVYRSKNGNIYRKRVYK